MSESVASQAQVGGQESANEIGEQQQDEHQRSLQHPHLPSDLVSVSEQPDANAILLDAAAAAAAAAAAGQQEQDGSEEQKQHEVHDEQKHDEQTEEQAAQDYTNQSTDQDGANAAANFFDHNYQAYDFPTSSAALAANNGSVTSSFPFQTHPHPQHPHLGVEALGHAAAASQHAGRVVPGVNAPEGEGGSHVFEASNGGDPTMDMTMTTDADDSTGMDGQQERSSGKAARTSLSVPGSDGTGDGKKNTPYSRSPDMRNSHKLAERKRRKEMKDLFDELRDEIPVERGPKTSKWEILQKAVEYVRALRKERDEYYAQANGLRSGEQPPEDHSMAIGEEVEAPAPAPEEEGNADEYAKYQEQQVASQQQVEAAAAAANQFTAQQHEYTQNAHEEQAEHQDDGEYKHEQAEQTNEGLPEQGVEQDWSAIAQAAQAQAQAAGQ